jgi:toxin-antitoxin system PIN domain toxin
VSAFLLDVNVLVAMSWPGHRFHEAALRWFAKNNNRGWATCPMVQAGFVHIVPNPSFSPRAISIRQAVEGLEITIRSSTHEFWTDDIPGPEALEIATLIWSPWPCGTGANLRRLIRELRNW